MGGGRYPVGMVKRIEVDPADVRVTTIGYGPGTGGSGAMPPPVPAGVGGWLRRYRLRLAGALAIVEVLLWSFTDVSKFVLLLLAAAAVGLHFFITPRVPSYTFRQVSWVFAFAQALVAIGSVLLVLFTTVVALLLFLFLVLLVIGGLAALLGDRR